MSDLKSDKPLSAGASTESARESASCRPINAEAVEITGAKGLDAIQVFWRDIGPGVGSVVITCYGCAWTAYWGAMGDCTIRQFFAGADTYYLVNKLGITPLLKQRKAAHAYLARIVDAIKAALPIRAISKEDAPATTGLPGEQR